MKIVSRGRNPHIVNLVGCVTIQETAMQVPFGTPFVYHVTPVQSLQVQRPVITPIFTVLPKGAVPQVTPVLSSPTAPLVIGETTSPFRYNVVFPQTLYLYQ